MSRIDGIFSSVKFLKEIRLQVLDPLPVNPSCHNHFSHVVNRFGSFRSPLLKLHANISFHSVLSKLSLKDFT